MGTVQKLKSKMRVKSWEKGN